MTAMLTTLPATKSISAIMPAESGAEHTIGTRVWIEEYTFLQSLFNSAENCSPKFRFPDLISACVSLVFQEELAAHHIFTYLHTKLVLRNPDTLRRQEQMWMPQYQLLLALQRSPANEHPNPQFKLDQFTTACISLAMMGSDAKRRIFDQARKNTANRAHQREQLSQPSQ